MIGDGDPASVAFSEDRASVTFGSGDVVHFTRAERKVLDYLFRNPTRILSRSQLLDAMAETGSDSSDRNIDFVINRIRRKLRDSARSPKFIATHYGEGYQWIFQGDQAASEAGEAHLVVGPLLGLASLEGHEQTGRTFARYLVNELQQHLGSGKLAAFQESYQAPEKARAAGPEISIQLGFFRDGESTECVLTARNDLDWRICHVERVRIPSDNSALAELSSQARRLAPAILAKCWKTSADNAVMSMPLPVAMHVAGRPEKLEDQPWPDNDRRLKALMAETPDDPVLKMFYASHLHTKYVLLGPRLFRTGKDTCAEDEAEIERLVTEALPFVQAQPEYSAMAAKLLYFVDRGYRDLALELADRSLRESTSVASSLAISGQLRGFVGDMDIAQNHLLQAEALCTPRSQFHIYVLVLLCQVLMAAGERDKLLEATRRMYRANAATRFVFEPLFSDPDRPSLSAKGVTLALSRKKLDGLLRHVSYISARLFQEPAHRENTLRTLVNLAVRRFGADFVHEDVRKVAPGLF